jgi:ABC-type lipoprotein release transport system permease subunit
MCEWLKQAVLKTALPERVTGVRIPLPPPCNYRLCSNFQVLILIVPKTCPQLVALGMVALIAALGPALRASKTDPMQALRTE